MKTVTGKVVSSKPVSLSSAAKNLSSFASLEEENGASDAVRVYLKRASDAFNSLVLFHKELKAPNSSRKRKASQLLDVDAKIETLDTVEKSLGEEKIKNVESNGMRKENREVEVNNEGQSKIAKDKGGIDEIKAEKKLEKKGKRKQYRDFEPTTEGLLKVDWNAYEADEVKVERSSDKKRKGKKDGQSQVRSEQNIDPSPEVGEERKRGKHGKHRRSEDREERHKDGNTAELEIADVERDMDGVEGEAAKKDKKKRKKYEGKEDGENVDSKEDKKSKTRDADGRERSESTEQSGKKKRKLKGDEL